MSQTISNSNFGRNDVVSLVKACGIIFMVLLHSFPSGVCHHVQNFFGVYHMPLFFIMSGFCFKEKYVNDVWAYVKGRLKGVWWPYVKYSVLFVLLHNVFFHLNVINEDYGLPAILYSWQEIASHAVMALYFHSHEAMLGGYWFLDALFFGSFIFFFFKKWIRKNPMINCFVLLLLSAIIKYYGGNPLWRSSLFVFLFCILYLCRSLYTAEGMA